MAAIDARLTREIRESGAAGAIIFAWMDEWFKKNWIVIDFERPAERNRLWLNAMDAEQNYGILGQYPGAAGARGHGGGAAGGGDGVRKAISSLPPAQITADTNDYNPGTGSFFRLDSSGNFNITGFAGGTDGRIIVIANTGLALAGVGPLVPVVAAAGDQHRAHPGDRALLHTTGGFGQGAPYHEYLAQLRSSDLALSPSGQMTIRWQTVQVTTGTFYVGYTSGGNSAITPTDGTTTAARSPLRAARAWVSIRGRPGVPSLPMAPMVTRPSNEMVTMLSPGFLPVA